MPNRIILFLPILLAAFVAWYRFGYSGMESFESMPVAMNLIKKDVGLDPMGDLHIFWFSKGCPPCVLEIPTINALAKRAQKEGFQVMVFGNDPILFTDKHWRTITAPKMVYGDTAFTAPLLTEAYLKTREQNAIPEVYPTYFHFRKGRLVKTVQGIAKEEDMR